MGVARSETGKNELTLVVPTTEDPFIKEAEKNAKKQIAIVEKLEVKTKEDIEFGSAIGTVINTQIKGIEAKRLEITGPLNESLNATNALFKLLKKPFEQSKKLLNEKVTAWHVAEETRIREKNEKREREETRRRKIQESHKERGHKVSDEVPVIDSIAEKENKIGSGHITKTWTFEVLDESKVPALYKKIDEVTVRNAIREGERNISGLRIYQKASTVFK